MNGYTGQSIGSGSLGGASITMPSPAQPDCIGAHMNELEQSIGALDEAIGGLIQRIDPILRPNPIASGKEANNSTPIRSSVANSLASHVERVKQITRRVSYLREAVDL